MAKVNRPLAMLPASIKRWCSWKEAPERGDVADGATVLGSMKP